MFKAILVLVVLILTAGTLLSQPYNYSNLRSKKIAASTNIKIDSLSIVPRSFFIKGFDTSYYSIDEVNATLSWKKPAEVDSVNIIYRVLPFKFNEVAKRFTYDSVMNNFIARPVIINRNGRSPETSLFDFGTINYNGSFGRALTFGNNQDVVVNSQFNLQLNGLIGDSVQVAAAITDNNIPIQPDGTTQQLNEFDRVWLQFKKNGWEVNLGDIDIRQSPSYFLKFYKRLQGISYSQQSNISKKVSNNLLVSGAVAKGKFTRNVFQGLEGNQGPYRLTGANNEFYFIVLAGTERVFLDGELMQRGEDQDYVINYNTAEIAFTPRRMITKDRRIQVEFEYADRNYLNSLLYANNEITINKKLKINIGAYSNTDAKNSPINQTLDLPQRRFLSNLGDSIQNAFYQVANLDTFSTTKILYKRIDTIYNFTFHDSIFVYSTDKDSARYSLNFIEVGFGKGNYIADFNGANGKVYKWVEPLNGVPQGNFEPATFLITPKKQQLFSVGANYQLNNKTNLVAEVAISNYDLNAFSGKDKQNDKGYGAKFLLTRNDNLITKTNKKLRLNTTAGYELVDKKFRPLERLRTVEFYRDWGLELQPAAATEHLPFINFQLSDAAASSIQYHAAAYIRSDDYKGIKQLVTHQQTIKGWRFNNIFNLTNINSRENQGYFLRPTVDISKLFTRLNNYTLGGSYAVEHNELRNKRTDSVSPLSFAFTTISAYLRSNQAKDNRWSLTYFTRSDKIPYAKALEQVDRSHNVNLSAEFLANPRHQVRTNVTYRQLQVINKNLSNLKPENSVVGRAEYSVNEFKGLVTGNVLYELGAGQEQRRDYSYIEVPAGTGEFAWNDYNSDGIPQLNEFELALFPDQAKFIRIFTPTNQFVKANYTQLNYSVTINPRAVANTLKNKKWGSLVGRFSLQSSMQILKKELADGGIAFNPLKGGLLDTSLITINNVVANTLSFNRFSTRWGIDVSNTKNFTRALLTYGFETRRLNEWIFRSRINLTKEYLFEVIQRVGSNSLITPRFANRNYELGNTTTEPRFTYTKGTNLRLQTSYLYNRKQNQITYGGETSTNNSMNFEGKYNAVNNTSLTSKFTYSRITYTGTPNTTVSYIMLDALLPGSNLLWGLDLTKRLINSLELNIQYEGRKPGETRTIHIGRVSLRAIL